MENFYEIDHLVPKLDRDSVLKAMDCYEDSPVYEEVVDEYEEICEDMLKLAEPVGILGFGTLSESIETKQYKAGTPVIYAVLSIGDGIKQCSTKAFQEGDYVKGMLCDAIADDLLFSLEGRMMEKLKESCAEHKMGILKRLEAPHDISMESQRVAWEHLELQRRFGIGISSGYMFDPVKTSCQVFILTEDESVFQAHHDCRKCPNIHCKMRNIPKTEVEVIRGNETRRIVMAEGEFMMDALIREGFYLSAPCGGKGRCGKCGVQVLEGDAWITPEDEKTFTKDQLNAGWRLSCRLYPTEDLKIAFTLNDESVFEILGDTLEEREDSSANSRDGHLEKTEEDEASVSGKTGKFAVCKNTSVSEMEESGYEIAVDIGTTTIAMELLGKDSGKKLHTVTCINEQRAYGADVISRIQASVDGKKEELKNCIRQILRQGIRRLTAENGIFMGKIERISIAGNTTMGHLLMGYDCDTLGVYPFTPVNIDLTKGSYEEILGTAGHPTVQNHAECTAEVELLPGISTYVGGDIVSGLYACGVDSSEEICLLVDLGTNGEMALGNKERILVTSTAAGPAFEGGNITWGIGSVAGAICSVEIHDQKAAVKTILNQPPVGICGTGVVETATELVRNELVDETGLMDEDYFEDGFPLAETEDGRTIAFTRKDVREIQLAKAAVRAGAETLILRYGISKDQISRVYLAGGFGYKLDKEKALAIGLLPPELGDRIEAVGNSSLSGAAKYLRDPEGEKKLKHLVEISQEVSLSTDKEFNEFYMDYMMFDGE